MIIFAKPDSIAGRVECERRPNYIHIDRNAQNERMIMLISRCDVTMCSINCFR